MQSKVKVTEDIFPKRILLNLFGSIEVHDQTKYGQDMQRQRVSDNGDRSGPVFFLHI